MSPASLAGARRPHPDHPPRPAKATTVLAMLNWRVGVKPSYSRPRVSDDNAYAEALFRTATYRPEFSAQGFADLDATRTWAARFVGWYNVDHRHSGIRYVTPAQRHAGEDHAILAARHALYAQARELTPARWSGRTRNWTPTGAVTLDPERDSVARHAPGGRWAAPGCMTEATTMLTRRVRSVFPSLPPEHDPDPLIAEPRSGWAIALIRRRTAAGSCRSRRQPGLRIGAQSSLHGWQRAHCRGALRNLHPAQRCGPASR